MGESIREWFDALIYALQADKGMFWAAVCGGIIVLCALLSLLRRVICRRSKEKYAPESKSKFCGEATGETYPQWTHMVSPSGNKSIAFIPVEQDEAGEGEGDFLTLAEKISGCGDLLPETLVQRIKKRNPYSLAEIVAAWPNCSPLLRKQLTTLVDEQQMMSLYLRKILNEVQSPQVFFQAWPLFGSEALLESMVELLGNRDEKLQMTGVKLLSTIKDPRTAPPLAMALMQPARYLPARVADVFVALGKDGARLLVYLLPEVDGENKIRVLQVLGQMRVAYPADNVIVCLQDANPAMRVAAVEALGANPSLSNVSSLSIAVDDENAKVRAAVAKALGEKGDLAAEEWLTALSRDDDWVVAATAKEALANLKSDQRRFTL